MILKWYEAYKQVQGLKPELRLAYFAEHYKLTDYIQVIHYIFDEWYRLLKTYQPPHMRYDGETLFQTIQKKVDNLNDRNVAAEKASAEVINRLRKEKSDLENNHQFNQSELEKRLTKEIAKLQDKVATLEMEKLPYTYPKSYACIQLQKYICSRFIFIFGKIHAGEIYGWIAGNTKGEMIVLFSLKDFEKGLTNDSIRAVNY